MIYPALENFYLRGLQVLPALSLLGLVIIDYVFWPVFLNLDFHLVFSGLFYWLLYRRSLISPFFLIFLGLFRDSIVGNPLGFSSYIFLIAYGFISLIRQNLYGRSFVMVWGGFTFFIILIEFLECITFMILVNSFIDLYPLLFQLGFTILFYPILTFFLFKVYRWVPRKR